MIIEVAVRNTHDKILSRPGECGGGVYFTTDNRVWFIWTPCSQCMHMMFLLIKLEPDKAWRCQTNPQRLHAPGGILCIGNGIKISTINRDCYPMNGSSRSVSTKHHVRDEDSRNFRRVIQTKPGCRWHDLLSSKSAHRHTEATNTWQSNNKFAISVCTLHYVLHAVTHSIQAIRKLKTPN